jgi:hypothetical protein
MIGVEVKTVQGLYEVYITELNNLFRAVKRVGKTVC